jgi:5-methylcytosine-specific restriction protein A
MPHYNIGLTIDLDRWHDTRRRVEPPWRSWCKSPTWKSIRRHRLAEEPRCRQCAIKGRIVAASHVDHIEPHLGQWLLFFKYENTQSLCAHHYHMQNHPEKQGNSINKPTDRLAGAGQLFGADGRADFSPLHLQEGCR